MAREPDGTGADPLPASDPPPGVVSASPPAPVAPGQPPTSGDRRRRGYRALRYPGYRIYLAGMLARGIAIWLQLVSIPLLAVALGATPVELGLISALLFLPMLFIGALGGVLADRVDRGRVLIVTQFGSAGLSLALWALVASDAATLASLAAMALAFGIITAIELPLRQAYLTELVARDDVTSAVSLHATAWNTTRFIGPVVAGVLIATVGMAATFLFAAVAATFVALSVIWSDRYRLAGRRGSESSMSVLGDLREGARYAAGEATIRWSMALVVAAGILGIQAFQTLVPLLGARELGLDPGAYGLFVGMWGLGAVVGAVLVTTFARGDRRRWLIVGTLSMAAALGAIAFVDRVSFAYALAFALGLAQIALVQNCMVTVQSVTPDPLRGRVMGIWVTVFQGTAPLGAILAGVLATLAGVRGAMFLAAIALAVVGLVALMMLPRVAWVTPRMARQRMDVTDPTT